MTADDHRDAPSAADLDHLVSPVELADIATELARAAGTMAREGRAGGLASFDTKSTATDVVTEYDRAAESLIVGELRVRRPDDGVIGEEGSAVSGTSGIDWVIDPIDGTTNFLYGLPSWCVSIAATDRLGSLAGAVYLPVTDEMFVAWRGGGATCNGLPIRASDVGELGLALVATGFGYLAARRRDQAADIAAILPAVRDLRRLGSAAIDLCYVACGRVDAYYEQWLNPWDVAAGQLIAAEAGAEVLGYAGAPGEPDGLLAAAPGIADALHALVTQTISRRTDD